MTNFISTLPAILLIAYSSLSCSVKSEQISTADTLSTIKPVIVTQKVSHDSDDPAIWINPADKEKSLVIGTDKGEGGIGGLYAFNLQGERVDSITNLKRPNNVDVAYGLSISGKYVDIAVFTERNSNTIRVIALPDFTFIDNGGIPVFVEDSLRDPMGIALYTNPSDKKIYAIVGRKTGPADGYLYQYLLEGDAKGNVTGTLARTFGKFSGKGEIESIAADNELGYVYYSDEGVGVRKYYAHPDSGNVELALFATTGFAEDHEGISVYKSTDTTGFILVSDQQANQFQIFSREGSPQDPHAHPVISVVKTSTNESDGSDITSIPFANFPKGLFVAMSDNGTFQYYRCEDILK